MARRRVRRKTKPIYIVLAIIMLICCALGYVVYDKFLKPQPIPAKGTISFHFMSLGNGLSGDSIYIKAGDNDILIDAGSDDSSLPTIKAYLNKYVVDKTLEYVIVTHGDSDHIAGFAEEDGIFQSYECEVIIDMPKTTKTTATYNRYVKYRDEEVKNGAKHNTALECYNNENGGQRVYNLTEDGNVKFEVLYNYYYENKTTIENNYSVCVQFYHGSKKFLFTGDLEESGEEYLAKLNTLTKVELFKAGHHGSKTSSNAKLLEKIQPSICVVQCAIGDKYDFPKQDFIDRIAPYTKQVYVTTMANQKYITNGQSYQHFNGDVVVISDEVDGVYVECSASQTILCETEWFLNERIMPNAWKTKVA